MQQFSKKVLFWFTVQRAACAVSFFEQRSIKESIYRDAKHISDAEICGEPCMNTTGFNF